MRHKSHMGAVSLILLLSAVLCAVLARTIDLNGEVLKIPIIIRAGESGRREFRVPIKAQYRIGVSCSRAVPFDRLKELLLGGSLIEVTLQRGDTAMDIRHLLGSDFEHGVGSVAQLGNLNFSHDSIGQDIAYFPGEPGDPYALTYTVIRTVDELAATNPTLVIYFDPRQAVSRGIAANVVIICGCVFAILGTAAGIFYIISAWRQRR